MEVTNRFKGLDLTEYLKNYGGHDIVQEAMIKTVHPKKKCKKAKWLSEEALQITVKEEKRKAKEKRKDIPI